MSRNELFVKKKKAPRFGQFWERERPRQSGPYTATSVKALFHEPGECRPPQSIPTPIHTKPYPRDSRHEAAGFLMGLSVHRPGYQFLKIRLVGNLGGSRRFRPSLLRFPCDDDRPSALPAYARPGVSPELWRI